MSFMVFRATKNGLTSFRNRLFENKLFDQNNKTKLYYPTSGVHFVVLPPKNDKLYRIYLLIQDDREDMEDKDWKGKKEDAPASFSTRLGRYFRKNGIWDEERKGWVVGGSVWLCREDQIKPEMAFQGVPLKFGWTSDEN